MQLQQNQQQQQQQANLIQLSQAQTLQNAVAQQQQQQLLKMKKEDINEIIKQSSEKKQHKFFQIQVDQNNQTIITPSSDNVAYTANMIHNATSSTVLTPLSGFSNNSLEIILNQFDQQAQIAAQLQSPSGLFRQSNLQRPNNLKISNTTSSLLTPSPVTAYAFMQGLIANLNNQQQQQQKDFQSQFSNAYPLLVGTGSNGSHGCSGNGNGNNNNNNNNNACLLMTPTLPLNTPSALYTLAPLEATLNAFANTPNILAQANIN